MGPAPWEAESQAGGLGESAVDLLVWPSSQGSSAQWGKFHLLFIVDASEQLKTTLTFITPLFNTYEGTY